MLALLKQLYDRVEQIKGKNLAILLSVVFGAFLVVGLGMGYIVNLFLNGTGSDSQNTEVATPQVTETFYEGKISYISPGLYPEDEISYALTDDGGEQIMLLKSRDQKLVVSEGHIAKVYGKIQRSPAGTEYLLVDKVIIQNATSGASE